MAHTEEEKQKAQRLTAKTKQKTGDTAPDMGTYVTADGVVIVKEYF